MMCFRSSAKAEVIPFDPGMCVGDDMCFQWYGYELCLLELGFCCLAGNGSGWSLMYDIYSKNPCDFKKNGRRMRAFVPRVKMTWNGC